MIPNPVTLILFGSLLLAPLPGLAEERAADPQTRSFLLNATTPRTTSATSPASTNRDRGGARNGGGQGVASLKPDSGVQAITPNGMPGYFCSYDTPRGRFDEFSEQPCAPYRTYSTR